MNPSRFPAYLALGVGILSLGFSAIFVRWANAPGIVTSFYRMTIAAALLAWPFYRRVKANKVSLSRQGLRFAVLGGLFFAADLALWSTGVVMSGATNPTLLANTAPLWVGLGCVIAAVAVPITARQMETSREAVTRPAVRRSGPVQSPPPSAQSPRSEPRARWAPD